jgi:aminoglycoside phosphotransferase
MTTATVALAPDSRLPGRDRLLDPVEARTVLAGHLGDPLGTTLDSAELVRVKYRVGESLRAVYRLLVRGREQVVAARMFTDGGSAAAYRRAAERTLPSGALCPVARDAGLDTVFWTFPNDRRMTNLGSLDAVPPELRSVLGPAWVASQLVAYAPEKSATARCLDQHGTTLGYVKAYAHPEARCHARVLRSVGSHRLGAGGLRVPAVLASCDVRRMLWLEPVPGAPLGDLRGTELATAMRLLGATLGVLHEVPPAGLPTFGRFDLARIRRTAEVIALARPELAEPARRLAGSLVTSWRLPEAGPVHLHGDAHPRNVLVDDGRLALIDLDQAGAGDPAADLGGVLARLRHERHLGRLDGVTAAALAGCLLDGYAETGSVPTAAALRWHTAAALLVERALRAVNRVIVPALPSIGLLIEEAAGLLADPSARRVSRHV